MSDQSLQKSFRIADNVVPITDSDNRPPKRSFSNHEKSLKFKESTVQHQRSKIRISHQKIFMKLFEKQEQLIEQHEQHQQHLESSSVINPDVYLTTTQEQSGLNSSFESDGKSQVDDSEVQQSKFNDKNEVLIPLELDQQEIEFQKDRQKYLIRKYAPLQYHEIFPWMNQDIQEIQDTLLRLHEEIRSFYLYIKPSKKQTQIRMGIFNHIKEIIEKMYPGAQIHPFGSFASKLYLPDGDIDIVALIQHQTKDISQTKELYEAIYQQFRRNHSDTYSQIKYVSSAKIPLVKMVHRETGCPIDISLNVCSGLNQIQNLEKMKRLYPEFKYLIFVLKIMLKIRNLNETYTGGVGSFLLVCMLFHYLREFHKSTPASQVKRYSLGDYLLGFFSFYFMNVDYYKQTIEVKSGIVRSRRRKPYSISMISPLDGSTDIGKKVTRMEDVLLIFKNRTQVIKQKSFAEGESILKEIINPVMTRFEYYDLKEKYKSEDGQQQQPQQQEPYEDQKYKFMETFSKQQNEVSYNNHQNKYKQRRYHRVKRYGHGSSSRDKRDSDREDENESNELSSISY